MEIFHVQMLRAEFDKRATKNSHYSLRSFARDLSVSASWLSEVFTLKKGISASKAEQICLALKLSRSDSKKFILSVQTHHSRSHTRRAQAKNDFQIALSLDGSSKKFNTDEFAHISDWQYYAILELIELVDCKHTNAWLAEKLQLPVEIVAQSVQKLIDEKLLAIVDGKMVACHVESETSCDIPSEAIKSYHHQVLKKAEGALYQQAVQQREFLNMTLAFDANKLEAARQEIRKFQRAFADKFYTAQEPKNSVYQLSLQFFRMDQKGETNG